jgi:hypothetical protein
MFSSPSFSADQEYCLKHQMFTVFSGVSVLGLKLCNHFRGETKLNENLIFNLSWVGTMEPHFRDR